MWKRGAVYSLLETRITPTSTWSIIIDSAVIVTHQSQRPRRFLSRQATSAATPARPLATIAT